MALSYIIPLVTAILLNTLDKLVARRTLRAKPFPDAFLLVYQLSCAALSFPFALAALASESRGYVAGANVDFSVGVLAVSAIGAWAGFAICMFRSTAKLELSITSTIGRTKLIWAAVLGVLLFGEVLSALHILGLGIILAANIFLTRLPRGILDSAGIFYALASAIFLSLALAFDKWLLSYFDARVVLFLGFFGTGIITLFINRSTNHDQFRSIAWSAASAAILGTAGYYLLLLAMERGPLSVVVPIYQSAHIVQVLAGIFVLREVEGAAPKLLAGAISLVGIVLIFAATT